MTMSDRPRLTRRQAEVLEFARDFDRRTGYSPTLEEIGEALGVNRVTAFEHVRALEEKGWIRTRKHCSRSIEILPDEDAVESGIPVLGRIAAGAPIEALEDPESLALSDLVPPGTKCFFLRVVGDSMIEDHIQDGDFVLVESRAHARPGETVVALLDGAEATLKRFYRQGTDVRLEPRNSSLQPIVVPAQRVEIQGIVVGVVRRCGR